MAETPLQRQESRVARLWDLHKRLRRREVGYDELGSQETIAEIRRSKAMKQEAAG